MVVHSAAVHRVIVEQSVSYSAKSRTVMSALTVSELLAGAVGHSRQKRWRAQWLVAERRNKILHRNPLVLGWEAEQWQWKCIPAAEWRQRRSLWTVCSSGFLHGARDLPGEKQQQLLQWAYYGKNHAQQSISPTQNPSNIVRSEAPANAASLGLW